MSQYSLLKSRRFLPFFVCQFLGAFNDNVFKNALIIFITFQIGASSGIDPNTMVNLCAGLFILPFFLFSAFAGHVADKFEKSILIRRIKLAEIGIMALASVSFLLEQLWVLIFLLFVMGAQSTFFGPVKYSILPQQLKENELVGGNALVEMGTFVAILIGTILAGILAALGDPGRIGASATMLAVALLGWLASREIPKSPAGDPALALVPNPITETWKVIRFTLENRVVFRSILGISWFWFYGATLLTQIPNYTLLHLGGNEQVVTLLLATFVVGIAAGSLLCERMSGHKVEIGLVPFGAIGLTIFAFDLALASPDAASGAPAGIAAFLSSPGSVRILADLTLMALFGGFYSVPLYALIQQRTESAKLARVIAGNNILNALFMVVSALFAIGMLGAGLSIPQLFFVVGLLNVAVAIYIFKLVPEFLMRFLAWMLVHSIYRLKVTQVEEQIPDKDPVVLACNHVSFVDPLIIMAACRRPIRFVMDHRIFKTPVLSFVFRTGRAIPIAPRKEDPEIYEAAFDEVARALEQGEIVGIFPEGRITRDGNLNDFRPGIENIVRRTPVPVIPIALRGLFGSFFSRKDGDAMSKPLRLLTRFWSKIELVGAPPVPPDKLSAPALKQTVAALRGDLR